MKTEKNFVPVMLTPFNENGAIDFEALTTLTNYYLNAGAKGLFANCQSSEMFDLSPEERLQVIAHVVDVAEGKVPVVAAGNFGASIGEQAIFVNQVYELGVQAVILLTNQLVNANEPEELLEAHIMELLSLTGEIPVGFYECPVPYKITLSPALLGRLVNTGRVIYHKDTCLDLSLVQKKNELTANSIAFGLYDAYMAHAVHSLEAGSGGLSCIQGNYFPELVVWLCSNYNNPELTKEVQMVQQFFIDEMQVMHEDYPVSAKYFLQKKGLPISTYIRKNRNAIVSGITSEHMDQLYKRYNALAQSISTL
ncbi:dihydrodipicolinate synthase family protein [Niabella hibiscisoli]|uniref:dihydrodipicolinate synthase family protein n=1 Tax=Niabella hibiscisoli TaxID=1825928 RepID=UPI001F117ED2|nr:dihydrodipicolinate synthase family protein [Niabella hibiscisoli]MCH5719028.1 dihydrodipicolinate synthase family protein [Niabella hibiscisoli]